MEDDIQQPLVLGTKENVGFMYGFEWSSSDAINYHNFKQIWHGIQQDKNKVFHILHKYKSLYQSFIESTKSLPQHKCVNAFRIFYNIVGLFSTLLGLYVIINSTLPQQDRQDEAIIGGVAVFSVLLFLLSKFGPIGEMFGRKKLRTKIGALLNKLNLEQLKDIGYRAEFPGKSHKVCYCCAVHCCDLIFPQKDLSRLEIFKIQPSTSTNTNTNTKSKSKMKMKVQKDQKTPDKSIVD